MLASSVPRAETSPSTTRPARRPTAVRGWARCNTPGPSCTCRRMHAHKQAQQPASPRPAPQPPPQPQLWHSAGSAANGVTSSSYGSWSASFRFTPVTRLLCNSTNLGATPIVSAANPVQTVSCPRGCTAKINAGPVYGNKVRTCRGIALRAQGQRPHAWPSLPCITPSALCRLHCSGPAPRARRRCTPAPAAYAWQPSMPA